MYQQDRRLSDQEVQTLFERVAPALIGLAMTEATARMGPFNAWMDNDRGRLWFEWRADTQTLVAETLDGRIVGFALERSDPPAR